MFMASEPHIEQFYPVLGGCSCPELERLRWCLKDVDRDASDAQACDDRETRDGKLREAEIPTHKRFRRWADDIIVYGDEVASLTAEGHTSGKAEDCRFIPIRDAITDSIPVSGVYCAHCHTEIPKPKYRNWTFRKE